MAFTNSVFQKCDGQNKQTNKQTNKQAKNTKRFAYLVAREVPAPPNLAGDSGGPPHFERSKTCPPPTHSFAARRVKIFWENASRVVKPL